MPKNYAYRMDHDTGFAPNVTGGTCTLCGCTPNTVEKWAQPEAWIIGVGGNGTGKPGRLIYMMHVQTTTPLSRFRTTYARKSQYLHDLPATAKVLFSEEFYYLGSKALELPQHLQGIIPRGRAPKCVSSADVVNVLDFVGRSGIRAGVTGEPNNPPPIECPKTPCPPNRPPQPPGRSRCPPVLCRSEKQTGGR
jgi:hypothetical protein